MKTPSTLFAVSAALAFNSACALGGTVPEEVPAGDEAADQRRIATEAAVEIPATESPSSIEELKPYIADGALPKIQHVKQTKGGPVAVQTQEYEAKTKAIVTVVKVLACKCALLGMDASAKGRDQQKQNWPPPVDQFRPGVLALPGHHNRVNEPNQIK